MTESYFVERSFAKRVKKSDLKSLRQLHQALTENISISHYAQLPEHELQGMRDAVESALIVLEPRPRQRRPQVKKEPVAMDLSTLREADLFADESRWPRRPYCTEDLASGLRIRSLRHAIERPYLQANPPHLRVWALFDIDRPGAAGAWESAGLSPPAWTAINRINGHAHSAWGLSAPVLVDGLGARDAPMRYLCAVESMMRERLQADTGYSGLITKNPAHPLWQTLRGPRMVYDLRELADALPGIEKYRPRGRVEAVGLGRNVTLFDEIRRWAYKGIRAYWRGGLQGWNAWLLAANSKALEMNADLFGGQLLDGREVWHIARSVAKWTWANTTPEGFSAWQSAQGAKGGRPATTTANGAPWDAEGISRATWYRQRARK